MLNALNEVLRDDFIKDSVAGVGRWNKVLEKAGIADAPDRAAQGVQPPDRRARRHHACRPTAASSSEAGMDGQGERVAAEPDDFAFVASLMGRVRRAGQVRRLDRAAGDGHQQAAGRFRIRAIRLIDARGMGDGRPTTRRRHQAAPDRPRDLHPLQHLRGDLPGRRDHARRPQLRRARRRLQLLHGLHLAVPDRLDRQLAHHAEWRAPTRSRSSSTWDELPPELTPEQLAAEGVAPEAAARAAAEPVLAVSPRPRPAKRRSTPPRSARPCRRGRPRTPYTNLLRAEEPDHGHRRRQRQLHRGRLRQPDAPHRARLRRHAVPGARRPVDRHRAARRRRATAGRTSRASTRSPARATASGPATTTSR